MKRIVKLGRKLETCPLMKKRCLGPKCEWWKTGRQEQIPVPQNSKGYYKLKEYGSCAIKDISFACEKIH